MDWMDIAIKYIKPELLVVVFILWYLGVKLKAIKGIPDFLIPFILLGVSIILALSYVLIVDGINPMAVWVGIIQGLVIAAVEGQAYQYKKQLTDKKDPR